MSEQKVAPVVKSDHDLEQLEVRLLFLVEQPNQMHASTSFLIRRGWKAIVTKDAAEALRMISKEGFDYVLISVNHPNPKVAQLALLIPQTFNTQVISIAEKADAKTIGLLNTARTAEKLLGRISGPAIHRKIRQLLALKYGLNAEKTESHARAGSPDKAEVPEKEEYFRFKREATESGYIEVSQTKKTNSIEHDDDDIYQYGVAANSGSDLTEEHERVQSTGAIVAKKSKEKGEMYISSGGQKPKKDYPSQENENEFKKQGDVVNDQQDEKESGVYIQKGANLKLKTHIPSNETSGRSRNARVYAQGNDTKESTVEGASEVYTPSEQSGQHDRAFETAAELAEKHGSFSEAESKFLKEKNQMKDLSENSDVNPSGGEIPRDQNPNEFKVERKSWLKEDITSDLFFPIKEALENIGVQSQSTKNENKLPQNTIFFGVIPFEVKRSKYFMVICFAGSKESLEERLFDLYGEIHGLESANSQDYKLGEPQTMECMPTDFEETVYSQGLASFTDRVDGKEICISIFERQLKPVSLELEIQNSTESRIKFELNYLKTNEKIDFTLYLLMPSQRFIKYIKPGGGLSDKQLEKLQKNSASIFVDREEKLALDKYMLTIEVEELILHAENNKAA